MTALRAAPDPLTAAAFPAASSLLPWDARDVSVRPLGGDWWSFNPSVHYDIRDGAWRCVFRVANYSLPGGSPRLSAAARGGRAETRNFVADLDPASWGVVELRECEELDGLDRVPGCQSLGYEDVRMFRAGPDLMGVATVLQFNRESPGRPEVALFQFGRDMSIEGTRIIRGPWSYRAQKNWSPFDGAAEPRLLYSIERGVVVGERGPEPGSPSPVPPAPPATSHPRTTRGAEVKIGSRVVEAQAAPARARRADRSDELRGGSQLVRVGEDRWLGVAHEMALVTAERKKLYWHSFYACDGRGALAAMSEPMKLSPGHGIEFAAGLAVDERGRLAVSYGTDDESSWIARTDLRAVLGTLRPVSYWREIRRT